MIVVIEGIDASGKATQAEHVRQFFLREQFSSQVKTVKKHDFPHYQTQAGSVVGRILKGQTLVVEADKIDRHDVSPVSLAEQWSRDKALVIQSVMICDRLEHLPLLVEFAMDSKNLLILDRYKMSSIAYGAADGLDMQWMDTVQSCLPDADLNILLDIPVEVSKARRPNRQDYYEKNFEKLARIREVYLSEFGSRGCASAGEFVVLAGSLPVAVLKEQIVEAIWKRMNSFDDH